MGSTPVLAAKDLEQVLHSKVPEALRREIPAYMCVVSGAPLSSGGPEEAL